MSNETTMPKLYKVTAFKTDKTLLNVPRDPNTWPLKYPDREKTKKDITETLASLDSLSDHDFRHAVSRLSDRLKDSTVQGFNEKKEDLHLTANLEGAKRWALNNAGGWTDCGAANLIMISVYEIDSALYDIVKKEETYWFLADWDNPENVVTCEEIEPPIRFADIWGE